jgi:hypothetical protein
MMSPPGAALDVDDATMSNDSLLFNPTANPHFENFNFDLDRPPRFLFRTFDYKSSGHSDDKVIASPAAKFGLPNHTKDIFTLDSDVAISIVDKHLNPWLRKNSTDKDPYHDDNFMSWTTSLLYAVQYAYYRRSRYGCSLDQIKICVVDVSMFPPGQFIRSCSLLQAYHGLGRSDGMQNLYSTTLLVYMYTFGEYLSQGHLRHRRYCEKTQRTSSSVISMACLERNGIYTLYPELEDPTGHGVWALRTIQLRKLWHGEDNETISSIGELRAAINLATAWFKNASDPSGLAIYFLSFRKRKFRNVEVDSGATSRDSLPDWMRHPIDVKEFELAARSVSAALAQRGVPADTPADRRDSVNSHAPTDSIEHDMLQKLMRCYVCAD